MNNEEQLILMNPQDLELKSDGHGEFPNSYYVTKEGLEKIKEYLNNIKDSNE